MRAAEQHATSKNNDLSTRISALAVPWKRVALYATIAAGIFLLGFLPMWFIATRAAEQRDASQRAVRLAQLQNTLAAAVIDVQQGEYEPARQLISDFYTSLRRHIDGETGLFTPAQREGLSSLLTERDDLITLLARRDPSAKDRLVNVYSTYNKLANNGAVSSIDNHVLYYLQSLLPGHPHLAQNVKKSSKSARSWTTTLKAGGHQPEHV